MISVRLALSRLNVTPPRSAISGRGQSLRLSCAGAVACCEERPMRRESLGGLTSKIDVMPPSLPADCGGQRSRHWNEEYAMVTVNGNRAEFSFFRPQAQSVYLTGEFNGWRHGELSMTCDQGYWRASIHLSVGEYKFHYVADGQHFVDYAAFGLEPGPFGLDSVVRIAASSRKPTIPILPVPAIRSGDRRRRNISVGPHADGAKTDLPNTLSA